MIDPEPANSNFETGAPAFVVGYPRSGTTLVQLLVAAHPDFVSGPETHFFKDAMREADGPVTEPLSAPEARRVIARIEERTDHDLEDGLRDCLIETANEGGLAPDQVLEGVMRSFGEKASAKRWVEKTPLHCRHLEEIWTLFPGAQVVLIHRDPRDVVSSNLEMRTQPEDHSRDRWIYELARDWASLTGKTIPVVRDDSRGHVVRYEDLVSDPASSIEALFQALDAPVDPEALDRFSDHHEQVTVEEEEWKSLAAVGEIVDRRGVWEDRMTEQEAEIVTRAAAGAMQRWGYLSADQARRKRIERFLLLPQLYKAREGLSWVLRKATARLSTSS